MARKQNAAQEALVASLNEQSMQSIFDKVLFALRKQGVRSVGTNGGGDTICAYRGDGGVKCGVGHLIPSKAYVKSMEGQGIRTMDVWLCGLMPKKEELLIALQYAHDNFMPHAEETGADRMGGFEDRMKTLAHSLHLSYPAPTVEETPLAV